MKLRIRSNLHEFNVAIGQAWEAAGLGDAEVLGEASDSYELRHGKGIAMRDLGPMLAVLEPLRPPTRAVNDLGDADVELRLGMSAPASDYNLTLYGNSRRICERMGRLLGPIGMSSQSDKLGKQEGNVLDYGGAPLMLRQLIRWLSLREGIDLRENKEWDEDDDDIWLHVRDPEQEGRPAREYVDVVVETDAPAEVGPLVEALGKRGFANVTTAAMTTDGTWGRRFLVAPGPFDWEDGGMESSMLDVSMGELLEGAGVDLQRYPIERLQEPHNQPANARLSVPMKAWRQEELRAYAGPHPERFDLRVRVDSPTAAETLRDALHEAGFPHVLIEETPASDLVGYCITWGAAANESTIASSLRRVVEAEMERIGAAPEHVLGTRESDEHDQEVIIDFPLTGIDDGGLACRILATADRYDVSLRTATSPVVEPLLERLKALGFDGANHLEHHDVGTARISYGGAPPALIEQVRAVIREVTGLDCGKEKAWEDYDKDIWIDLPQTDGADAQHDEGAADLDLAAWLDPAGEHQDARARGFIDVGAEQVRIGRVELPRWQGEDGHLAPPPAAFAHYCIDELTAATLEHVALGVALREPVLLEGETSTSKTSSILYLAALLGQPAVRINLNGQTDTGELIGRYVPDDARAELPMPAEELAGHTDLLESETRLILGRAAREGRSLTTVEVQQVMANEGMRSHPWRWQDGLLVQALRRGWWVILDELNLAEPQILERLNSLLERDPGLVLTEHDNSVIGHGGEAVHHGFRIFGTMNPAEYAGRSVLSPAYRDRWVGYRFVEPPGEAAYLAMLRLLVWGEQPPVTVLGRRWQAATVEAPLGGLAEVPGMAEFLGALARFHSALQAAVGGTGAGARRLGQGAREPYVFTRRGLLRIMEYLASVVARDDRNAPEIRMREALLRYYLGRMRSAGDRSMMVRLLDAAGIGPDTWAPGTPAGDDGDDSDGDDDEIFQDGDDDDDELMAMLKEVEEDEE